ncbi:MAG: TRAM domain-containing protein [Patescibacteria group bacterium]|nr:TRAM domain-containing protein [Patescibacteria group bacterium]
MESTYLYLGLITIAIIIGMIVVGTKVSKLKANTFFIGVFGTVVGLLVGSLAYLPLSKLPGIYGTWVPVIFYVLMVVGFIWVFLSRRPVIEQTFETISKVVNTIISLRPQLQSTTKTKERDVLVDTSVLIDGRISDIAETGFIPGRLVVPKFILAELQNIADSDDDLRRVKGRRGLDSLEILKKDHRLKVEPTPDFLVGSKDPVDEKLVAMAKDRKALVITNDFNLNKVAKVEGVSVLNINELSQALRPVLIPGEEMELKIVQKGKEKDQGVAYLPDGTMIVVEKGDKLVGKKVRVEIKRVLQTAAGKMFFATLKNE